MSLDFALAAEVTHVAQPRCPNRCAMEIAAIFPMAAMCENWNIYGEYI